MTTRNRTETVVALAVLAMTGFVGNVAAQDAGKPLKVYILAGQSNMEGHAKVETFDYIGDDAKTAAILKEMRGTDGKPTVCKRVWISYLTGSPDRGTLGEGFGNLTAGYGSRSNPYGLTGGYSGIYYHNANAGFAHVFDPRRMPGAKAYGAPAPYWCEIWGAFSHNMKDPRWLGPHETVEATDLWFPLYGTHGLTGRAPGCEPGKCRFESGRPTLSNGRRTFVIDDASRTELRDCQEPWPRKELILALDGKQIGCHYIMHACLAPCRSE
jgi:hypothetical protein